MPMHSWSAPPAERSWVGQVAAQRSQLIRAVQRIAGGRTEAEDAVQEALVRAWRDQSRVAERRSIRGWVVGIARNVALDRRRAKNRRRETNELHSAIVEPSRLGMAPSARLRLEERQSGIRWALDQVSDVSREIVALRHEQELSFAQIAAKIEVSEPTARKRYSRALVQLREAMSA